MNYLLILFTLASCQQPSKDSLELCSSCILEDINNFSYTSHLSIGTTSLRSKTDAIIRWDELTMSIQGDKIDPIVDIDEARLIAFRDLTPNDIEYAIIHDKLIQSDISVYVTCNPIDNYCALSDFGMFGNTVDIQQYFQEGYGTWLLTLGKKEQSIITMTFLDAIDDTDNSEVYITNYSSVLDVKVKIDTIIPVLIPTSTSDIIIDWSLLTRDGIGDLLDHATLDELWVGKFTETPEELITDIFSLDERAKQTWTLNISGYQNANLNDLQGDFDFSGLDDINTWMLGLRCRTCTNPAPRFVTLLQGAKQEK